MASSLFEVFSVLQDADVSPTPLAAEAVKTLNQSTVSLQKQWEDFEKTDLPQMKSQLGITSFDPVPASSAEGMNQDED